MPDPYVSIIIPTRNRPEDLKRCLDRILPQRTDGDAMQILVGDDSDGHATAELLGREFPSVQCLRGPRNGPGANRNTCARAASGRWLIFLDDDCLPSPGLVAAYLQAMRDGGEEPDFFLAGPIYRSDEKRDSLLWEAPRNEKADFLPPSCNFAMPRRIFLANHGFDERYRTAFEDIEFFARLNILKIPVHFIPEAAVDHPSRPLPPPRTLARRWESRVISSFDFGATIPQILWLLPRHILLVILSRFRGRALRFENLQAAAVFSAEFAIALFQLPGWLAKYGRLPRSAFWEDQARKGNTPRRFGL